MNVTVLNQQKTLKIRPKLIVQLAELVLAEEKKDLEVSLRFVGDKAIAKFNEKYLHHKGPTDVIAFPMREGNFRHLHPEILGDVVISAERAVAQAYEFRKSPSEELCLYVVHGLLHLLGYDDVAPAPRRKMLKKQDAIMSEAANYFGKNFFMRAASYKNHKES